MICRGLISSADILHTKYTRQLTICRDFYNSCTPAGFAVPPPGIEAVSAEISNLRAARRCTNAEAQVGTRIVSLVKSEPMQSRALALADYYLNGQVRRAP